MTGTMYSVVNEEAEKTKAILKMDTVRTVLREQTPRSQGIANDKCATPGTTGVKSLKETLSQRYDENIDIDRE